MSEKGDTFNLCMDVRDLDKLFIPKSILYTEF